MPVERHVGAERRQCNGLKGIRGLEWAARGLLGGDDGDTGVSEYPAPLRAEATERGRGEVS